MRRLLRSRRFIPRVNVRSHGSRWCSSAAGSSSPWPTIQLWYGSETGTAMEFALETAGVLSRRLPGLSAKPSVTSLGDASSPNDVLVPGRGLTLLCMAVFGEGQPTTDAAQFYHWLMNESENHASIAGCTYGVLGFGRSSYAPERYQVVGRRVDARLSELGAHRVLPIHEADDDGDVESYVDEWIDALCGTLTPALESGDEKALEAVFGPRSAAKILHKVTTAAVSDESSTTDTQSAPTATGPSLVRNMPYEHENEASISNVFNSFQGTSDATNKELGWGLRPLAPDSTSRTTSLDLATVQAAPECVAVASGSATSVPTSSRWGPRDPFCATLSAVRQLHNTQSPRPYLHLEFELPDGATYETGDYVAIVPENEERWVWKLATLLGLDLDQRVVCNDYDLLRAIASHDSDTVQGDDAGPATSPGLEQGGGSMALRDVLRHHVDLLGPVRRSTLLALADYTQDPWEQERLRLLASSTPVGRSDYTAFIAQPERTLLEVLTAFPSVRLNVAQLLDVVSPLAARFYSVASSPLVHPHHAHLTLAVGHHTTRAGREHWDLTPLYLSNLRLGDRTRSFFKRSLFRLPEDPSRPILCFAAGAGVAPFRAFLQHRLAQQLAGQRVGVMTMVLGVDHRAHDWVYRRWLLALQREYPQLLRLVMAFGAELMGGLPVWVQHQMIRPDVGSALWSLANDHGAPIYVCGSARTLGPAVRGAWNHLAQREGGMQEEEVDAWMKQKRMEGMYVEDCF